MVLDLARISSDLELKSRIRIIDHGHSYVRSSSNGDWLMVGHIAAHNQRSDSIECELLARVLGCSIADILIAEPKHHRLWKRDIDRSSDDRGVERRHRNVASVAVLHIHSRLVVQCAIGSSDIGTHVRSRICEHLDQVHSSGRCTTIVHRLARALDQRCVATLGGLHADVLVCVELHIDAERVIDHHVQQCADIQHQRTHCDEPRSRNIERRASRLVPHELVVLADASSAADHRTDERRDASGDDMGGMQATTRSFGSVLGHSAAEHQRSDTSDGQLLAPVHSCAIDELDTGRRSNDRVQCDHKLRHQHDSSEQHGTCIAERLAIRIILDGIMVLDLVRIASDHELGKQLGIDDRDRVYTTDRIECIDTIRRHSGSVEQRSCSIKCHVHIELHCSSINGIDAISIDDLFRISIIVIDQDDLDLEQWRWIIERVSIKISCIRLMVLDLVRISADHELESRLACIDHLDHVHATDRIESVDTIHRHSGSVEQRSCSIKCELHIELHCSSINGIDAIGIIDDLVWISIIVIDQDDLDLEQWRWIIERVSIKISCIRLMVLDPIRISSDHELESRLACIDHLDRVHTTDRIESVDTTHRHSGSVEQRSCSIERELHIELHCSSINGIDTIGIIDDLFRISIIVIDQDDLDLEQWRWIIERVSISIVCIRLMVLDPIRISSDHELESRLACIDHLDHVHATDRIECIDAIHRHSGSVEQRSCSIERELHIELHCSSIVLVDTSSIGDHIIQQQT